MSGIIDNLPQGLHLLNLPQPMPGFQDFIASWFFVDSAGCITEHAGLYWTGNDIVREWRDDVSACVHSNGMSTHGRSVGVPVGLHGNAVNRT